MAASVGSYLRRGLLLSLALGMGMFGSSCFAASSDVTAERLKAEIIRTARSFEGQADPDFSKQKVLDDLVAKLLVAVPQPPVAERLPLLAGTWKQIWGPYDYRRRGSREIDPEIGIFEIYQVVFPKGYYYNVSPLYEDGDRRRERIGLLRGEYELDDEYPNRLNVHFTRYRGVERRPPEGTGIWTLAPLAEEGRLEDEITIVPWIIVRLFFGRGSLDEVYTDSTLRITYGSSGDDDPRRSIYVLKRIQ